MSTTTHVPSATVSVTELQEILGGYQHIKQQLARLRDQVVMTERKGLTEVTALVSEDGEEGFKSRRRPHHDRDLEVKTKRQAEKETEEARVWMLKAEIKEMSQFLRQREEEHEEEKTRLQAYCIELEEQVAEAMEEAVHAQVVALDSMSLLQCLDICVHLL